MWCLNKKYQCWFQMTGDTRTLRDRLYSVCTGSERKNVLCVLKATPKAPTFVWCDGWNRAHIVIVNIQNVLRKSKHALTHVLLRTRKTTAAWFIFSGCSPNQNSLTYSHAPLWASGILNKPSHFIMKMQEPSHDSRWRCWVLNHLQTSTLQLLRVRRQL